jgi:hypothetical protein
MACRPSIPSSGSETAPTAKVATQPEALRRGLGLYRENRLADALPYFQAAVGKPPTDAVAMTWLAETLRRLGHIDGAAVVANTALRIAGCRTFAHTVLAAAYYPPYRAWDRADYDSTWHHARQAIACDSTDGNTWLLVWLEALRRGDQGTQDRALRSLVRTGFLTPTVLNYNRWALATAPNDAVVLTDGDLDTYPALALQLIEHLRPDVVVVHAGLLNLGWYARAVRDKHRLPMMFTDVELDTRPLCEYRGQDWICVADDILLDWRRRIASRALPRQLLLADTTVLRPGPGRFKLVGPLFALTPPDDTSLADTAALRRSLLGVQPGEFGGPEVSPEDRSPVRQAAPTLLRYRVLTMAGRYGALLRRSGRTDDAQAILDWMERFAIEAALDTNSAASTLIEGYRRSLRAP